jgi:hypothetical protein
MEGITYDNQEKRKELRDEYGVSASPGDGWLFLIEEFCEQLETLIDNYNRNHEDEAEWPDRISIKEKYGRLDIFVPSCHEGIRMRVSTLCSFVGRISNRVCEGCGSSENIIHTPAEGWRKTICRDCLGEERYQELVEYQNSGQDSKH